MAEIWVAAAVTVGGAVISGMGQEKKDKSDKKFSKEQSEQEARQTAQQTGYEAALQDFYNEKGRYEKQRGLDQYRQFSTMQNFAPGVDDQAGRVVMPTAVDYNNYAPTVPTAPAQAGGGGGGRSLTDKLIDPLGIF